jgi:nitronate monooxygenase
MSLHLEPLNINGLIVPIPIIQGGMGVRVSSAELAAAVANCGGAGTIASVGLVAPDESHTQVFEADSRRGLIDEIRKARALSNGVIGVNILAALSNFEDLARTSAQEGADYIISGAGLPLKLPEYAEGSSTKLIPIVSSARVASLISKTWYKRYNRIPDAFVVEGPLAGGHLGFSREEIMLEHEGRLEELVLEVLEVAREAEKSWGQPIPVIAAGGIYDGADIARFFKLGARGVQMGTRFVVTNECTVPEAFKKMYIEATDEDIVLIESPVGLPGRALKNAFIEKIMRGEKQKVVCRFKCLKTCSPATAPYCIARALINANDEKLVNDAVIFAGRNASRVKEIISVKELMDELVEGTIDALTHERKKTAWKKTKQLS